MAKNEEEARNSKKNYSNLSLEAIHRFIHCQPDLNGESEGPIDQNDEWHFIDAVDGIVQLAIHHDGGCIKAEIKVTQSKKLQNLQ